MFKGFKEFLSRGNIVDLAVAVVIGTAFTALVTKFTDSIITPLINRIGVNEQVQCRRPADRHRRRSDHRPEHPAVGRDQLRLIAVVVYFFVVLPYNTLRKRGEVEQADDAQIVLLTEIRDLLAQTNGDASGKHGASRTTPPPDYGPRADAESTDYAAKRRVRAVRSPGSTAAR